MLTTATLSAEAVAGPEWAAWYSLTPVQRWEASRLLWHEYIALGGSLDPEVDTQSPFWSVEDLISFARNTGAARQALATPSRPSTVDP